MEYTFAQYQESAQALRDRLGAFRPRCLLILGSGLGSLGNEVESPIAVPYEDVPHMKRSTAPDHAGRFVFGRLAGQDRAASTPMRAGPLRMSAILSGCCGCWGRKRW